MPVRGVQRVDGVLWERTQAEACASLVVELGQLRVAVVEARGRSEILPPTKCCWATLPSSGQALKVAATSLL
jgi:hypothetical protein